MMFECHITCNLSAAADAQRIADRLHWSTSQIERDPVLGKASYFYLTTHGANYIDLYGRMTEASMNLRDAGIDVVREKIELIMHDTKRKV